MAEEMIREYRIEDVPELIRLWTAVFDDTLSAAEKFFTALPNMGSGVVAELDGKIAGAAYTLNGQELLNGGASIPIGYIYGVGVYEEYRHRGIGERLVKEVHKLSQKCGADIAACLPAQESLYTWYEKILGFSYILRCEKLSVPAKASVFAVPISGVEYMTCRENFLKDKTHIRLSSCAIEFQGQLLSEYGGGFYMTKSGLCAAYITDGKAVMREVIAQSREAAINIAETVGAMLGTKECELRLPSDAGEKYVASDKPLPSGCTWNLTFD